MKRSALREVASRDVKKAMEGKAAIFDEENTLPHSVEGKEEAPQKTTPKRPALREFNEAEVLAITPETSSEKSTPEKAGVRESSGEESEEPFDDGIMDDEEAGDQAELDANKENIPPATQPRRVSRSPELSPRQLPHCPDLSPQSIACDEAMSSSDEVNILSEINFHVLNHPFHFYQAHIDEMLLSRTLKRR
jgi:hypothetical protein